MKKEQRIADFFFELGTMRKLPRMHRQVLLTDDMSDNIASHSYRVAMIGWFLAKEEGVDPYKVVMMCLSHDLGEIRSNDHNWVHRRYVRVFEEQIAEEQLGTLPYTDLKDLYDEYENRETWEAVVAKDADLLDQILLLREYEWQGNREAAVWLHGKTGEDDTGHKHAEMLKTESAHKIAEVIYEKSPTEWWKNLWTSKRK
ncbi:HD domain-containing protein [Candidatus Wolfebacteria bacterium]|nr:HD domain-containing protein [Candidatus Wolfebacteria bacterium]